MTDARDKLLIEAGIRTGFAMGLEDDARWHEKCQRQCLEIANDGPRIPPTLRDRALSAAAHHGASAVGMRQRLREFMQNGELKYEEAK